MVGPKSKQRWQRITPQTRASSLPPGRVAAVLPTRRGWQRAGTGLNIGELKDMNIKRLTQVARDHRGAGAAVEGVFRSTLVSDEPEPLVEHEACNGSGRHSVVEECAKLSSATSIRRVSPSRPDPGGVHLRDILGLPSTLLMQAGVVKLADARDSKSRGLYRPWGFDSPLRHHAFNGLRGSTESSDLARSGDCHRNCHLCHLAELPCTFSEVGFVDDVGPHNADVPC